MYLNVVSTAQWTVYVYYNDSAGPMMCSMNMRQVAMCYNTYFIFSISFDTIQCCNSENWRTKKESYNYINKFLHWD